MKVWIHKWIKLNFYSAKLDIFHSHGWPFGKLTSSNLQTEDNYTLWTREKSLLKRISRKLLFYLSRERFTVEKMGSSELASAAVLRRRNQCYQCFCCFEKKVIWCIRQTCLQHLNYFFYSFPYLKTNLRIGFRNS